MKGPAEKIARRPPETLPQPLTDGESPGREPLKKVGTRRDDEEGAPQRRDARARSFCFVTP